MFVAGVKGRWGKGRARSSKYRVMALLSIVASLVGGAIGHAHQDPPDCVATGVKVYFIVFRADGREVATGGSATECESLTYQGSVCHPGENWMCNIEGGRIEIETPDGVVHDVTPPGGVPKLRQGRCTKSEPVSYFVEPGDIDQATGEITAKFIYTGAKIHNIESDSAIADADVTQTNNVVFCGAGNPCTGGQTCHPVSGCVPLPPLDCNDGQMCTDDGCDPDTGSCFHVPVTQPSFGDGRAYGIHATVFGQPPTAPAPDTNVANPGEAVGFGTAPVGDVRLLEVEKTGSGTAEGATASARASTAEIKLLDTGDGDFLVTASAARAEVQCVADETGAHCDPGTSVLENVTVNGQDLGTVTESTTLAVPHPVLGLVTVRLLEKIPVAANAGDSQPYRGAFSSGLAVNAIRVTAAEAVGGLVEVVVGHADSFVAFGNANTCELAPRVSGRGLIVRSGDTFELGRVTLPSTGGSDHSALAHLGPISDGSPATTLESRTGFSRTEGEIDPQNRTAWSRTETQVEKLTVLDTGTAPTNPLVSADAARAECDSGADPLSAQSTGKATFLNLRVGGVDVCPVSENEESCEPTANTVLEPVPGVSVILNEQVCDNGGAIESGCSDGAGSRTGITVNAIRVVFDQSIPVDENVGAVSLYGDTVVSAAHCGAAIP